MKKTVRTCFLKSSGSLKSVTAARWDDDQWPPERRGGTWSILSLRNFQNRAGEKWVKKLIRRVLYTGGTDRIIRVRERTSVQLYLFPPRTAVQWTVQLYGICTLFFPQASHSLTTLKWRLTDMCDDEKKNYLENINEQIVKKWLMRWTILVVLKERVVHTVGH